MTARYSGAIISNTLERKQRTMIAESIGAVQRERYVDDKNTIQHIEIRKVSKANALLLCRRIALFVLLFVSVNMVRVNRGSVSIPWSESPLPYPQPAAVKVRKQDFTRLIFLTAIMLFERSPLSKRIVYRHFPTTTRLAFPIRKGISAWQRLDGCGDRSHTGGTENVLES